MEHSDLENEEESTFIEFQFELVDTDDPCTLILVCVSNAKMNTEDYAQALIAYAGQLDHKINLKDTERSKMN